jgi:hypothetical protein
MPKARTGKSDCACKYCSNNVQSALSHTFSNYTPASLRRLLKDDHVASLNKAREARRKYEVKEQARKKRITKPAPEPIKYKDYTQLNAAPST